MEFYELEWLRRQRKVREPWQPALAAKRRRLLRQVAQIEDCVVRGLVTLRFLCGCTWLQTAMRFGGGNSADGVRMLVRRYFKKVQGAV